MKKTIFAFTLAEVLITLSILGVVATVTIPSLTASYRKAQAVTGLKIAYATITNVIALSEAINGNAEKWDWCLSSSEFAEKYFVPYFSYTTKKAVNGSSTKMKGIAGEGFTGSASNWGLDNLTWLTLKNGMDIGMKMGRYGSHNNSYNFWVDINGLSKGNNIVGKEIFIIDLKVYNSNCCTCSYIKRNKRAYIEPGLHDWNDNPDSMTIEGAMSSSIGGGCNKSAPAKNWAPTGAWCSYVIYKNGWKIPSNYPW